MVVSMPAVYSSGSGSSSSRSVVFFSVPATMSCSLRGTFWCMRTTVDWQQLQQQVSASTLSVHQTQAVGAPAMRVPVDFNSWLYKNK